jgi:NAD+ synthase (glutamine-hydrolysing)
MSFRSIYRHGFAHGAAACIIVSRVADPSANVQAILRAAEQCHQQSIAVAVFPELALSGYAIEDLLMQDALIEAVDRGIATLVEASKDVMTVLIVGAPLRYGLRIYNCAAVVHRGRLLGVVPKTYLPTYREFYEARHFASGREVRGLEIAVGGLKTPFGTDLLFVAEDVRGLAIGVEICEDMWIPVTPGSELALAGATMLANLSGSPITIGRASSRGLLCQSWHRHVVFWLTSMQLRVLASLRPISHGMDRPRFTRTVCCSPRAIDFAGTDRSPAPISTSICSGRSAPRWAPSTTIV